MITNDDYSCSLCKDTQVVTRWQMGGNGPNDNHPCPECSEEGKQIRELHEFVNSGEILKYITDEQKERIIKGAEEYAKSKGWKQ